MHRAWTVHIAERAGARVIKRPTLIAIQAACRFICKPHVFPSPTQAAEASGCDRRRCTEWIQKIGNRIKAEPAGASVAPNATWQRSFQAAVTYAPKGVDAKTPDGTPTCSLDETSALHGAVVPWRGKNGFLGPSVVCDTDTPLGVIPCVRALGLRVLPGVACGGAPPRVSSTVDETSVPSTVDET